MRFKMRVYVKNRYKDELNLTVVRNILNFLHLPLIQNVEYIDGNGRCVIIENNNEKIYVIVSRKSADARNAFLAQYIPTVLSEFIDDNCTSKKIYIFLLDTSQKAKTNFIIDTYRVAKTLGIDIINEKDLKISPIMPYVTFKDWKYAKTDRQNYNPANNSSYAMEEETEYTIFGKLYGANGKESSFTACQLAKIAEKENKKINFVQVKEHGTESISNTDRKLLEYYNVNVSDGAIILKDKQIHDKSTCRKQDEFKYNLLEKYGTKKCYLCGCDIEQNIIASHIHRITDIDHSTLSDADKRMQAVDADNGFWLCANHDKMFENGIITFNQNGNLVINPLMKENQINFIYHITDIIKIKEEHLTKNLLNYLLLHNKRVNLGL